MSTATIKSTNSKATSKKATPKKATPKKATSKKAAPASKAVVIESTPKKLTPLELATIKKMPKTILDSGMTYSLITRVRNAFDKDIRITMEKGSNMLEMVDGRGTEVKVSDIYLPIAEKLGGAEYLKSVRTSHVRRALKESGVAIKA